MINRNLSLTVLAAFSLIKVSEVNALVMELPTGNAVLGRPIEISLRAVLAPGEDPSTLCIEADVFQADVLVPPNKLRVQLLNTTGTFQAKIRISSTVVVDEPVLNVVVRSGCSQKSIRKFIVFADPPSFTSVQGEGMEMGLTVPKNQFLKGQGFQDSKGDGFAGSTSSSSGSELNIRPVLGTTEKISTRSTKSSAIGIEKLPTLIKGSSSQMLLGTSTAKLRLESLRNASDLIPYLRLSPQLTALPLENTPQRAVAAATWQVLSSTPEELQEKLQKLKEIQGEIFLLKNVLTQGQREKELNVERLNLSQYKNFLVYILVALLVLALLALSRFFFFNRNVSSIWWKSNSQNNESLGATVLAVNDDVTPELAQNHQNYMTTSTVNPVSGLFGRKKEEGIFERSDIRPREAQFNSTAYQANTRDVTVEELFDIQQQADFFISLEQYDQAVEVLESHISENNQTSPLIYLDLLSLYHTKKMDVEYRELAGKFTRLFNSVVPPFEAFNEKTQGLEAYSPLLNHIESLWHKDGVISVIENAVFRNDSYTSEALDWEAYRELLLLHSLAKDFAENKKINPNKSLSTSKKDTNINTFVSNPFVGLPFDTKFSSIVPLTTKQDIPISDSLGIENRNGSLKKPIGANIGLDIDLSPYTQPLSIATVSQNQHVDVKAKNSPEDLMYKDSRIIEFDAEAFKQKPE